MYKQLRDAIKDLVNTHPTLFICETSLLEKDSQGKYVEPLVPVSRPYNIRGYLVSETASLPSFVTGAVGSVIKGTPSAIFTAGKRPNIGDDLSFTIVSEEVIYTLGGKIRRKTEQVSYTVDIVTPIWSERHVVGYAVGMTRAYHE